VIDDDLLGSIPSIIVEVENGGDNFIDVIGGDAVLDTCGMVCQVMVDGVDFVLIGLRVTLVFIELEAVVNGLDVGWCRSIINRNVVHEVSNDGGGMMEVLCDMCGVWCISLGKRFGSEGSRGSELHKLAPWSVGRSHPVNRSLVGSELDDPVAIGISAEGRWNLPLMVEVEDLGIVYLGHGNVVEDVVGGLLAEKADEVANGKVESSVVVSLCKFALGGESLSLILGRKL